MILGEQCRASVSVENINSFAGKERAYQKSDRREYGGCNTGQAELTLRCL